MPMQPRGDEDKQNFISRCIAHHRDKGKDEDQAAAICYSEWDSAKKSELMKNLIAESEKLRKIMDGHK